MGQRYLAGAAGDDVAGPGQVVDASISSRITVRQTGASVAH